MVKKILAGTIIAAAQRMETEISEEDLLGLTVGELLQESQLIVAALTVRQSISSFDMVMRAVERAESEAAAAGAVNSNKYLN